MTDVDCVNVPHLLKTKPSRRHVLYYELYLGFFYIVFINWEENHWVHETYKNNVYTNIIKSTEIEFKTQNRKKTQKDEKLVFQKNR